MDLQQQLATIEDTIQNARRYYNAIVRDYNAKIASFPDLFIAQKFNFTARSYFELEDSEALVTDCLADTLCSANE